MRTVEPFGIQRSTASRIVTSLDWLALLSGTGSAFLFT